MIYKKVLLERFSNISDELDVRLDVDVSEERTSPYVLTIIEKSRIVINPGLPDYRISYDILLDCFILDDKNGEKFETFSKEIERICEDLSDRFVPINNRFDINDIVGCFFNGSVDGLTPTSNQRKFSIDLIISK